MGKQYRRGERADLGLRGQPLRAEGVEARRAPEGTLLSTSPAKGADRHGVARTSPRPHCDRATTWWTRTQGRRKMIETAAVRDQTDRAAPWLLPVLTLKSKGYLMMVALPASVGATRATMRRRPAPVRPGRAPNYERGEQRLPRAARGEAPGDHLGRSAGRWPRSPGMRRARAPVALRRDPSSTAGFRPSRRSCRRAKRLARSRSVTPRSQPRQPLAEWLEQHDVQPDHDHRSPSWRYGKLRRRAGAKSPYACRPRIPAPGPRRHAAP